MKRVTKIYEDRNVFDASLDRIRLIFDNFAAVCVSFSGGKDSSVMVQLFARVARERGRKFDVLYIDLEGMFSATTDHVAEVRDAICDVCSNFWWSCLPLIEDNAASALQPDFFTWDPDREADWIRSMPACAIRQGDATFPWYDGLMSFDEFLSRFQEWYLYRREPLGCVAFAIGIRTDESLNRFTAIASERKVGYLGKKWMTRVGTGRYNVYPIYDWRVADVWAAVFKHGLMWNRVYEFMYKLGVHPSKQRICQPFGAMQKAGLHQFAAIEPSTWDRMLKRVSGINYAAITNRASLLGQISSHRPAGMSWQVYAVYLLESLGLREPQIMARYYRKIKYFMRWAERNEAIPYGSMGDDGPPRSSCWRTVARALERNDFFLLSLSFGYDKAGDDLLVELRARHKLTGDGKIPPMLQRTLKKHEN